MRIILYHNASDTRVINKTLVGGREFEGVMRDEMSVMTPVIRLENESIIDYNYAFIPDLQRYYVVSSIDCYRDGIWDISLSVDVLMSFRGDIMILPVIVDKQTMMENGDEYIDDGSLVTDNITFTRLHSFEFGFNDSPEYILITAG